MKTIKPLFPVWFHLLVRRSTKAPCIVVTEDDLNAELAMIDENLCRTDISLAERAKMMVRRKKLYEENPSRYRPQTPTSASAHGWPKVVAGSTAATPPISSAP